MSGAAAGTAAKVGAPAVRAIGTAGVRVGAPVARAASRGVARGLTKFSKTGVQNLEKTGVKTFEKSLVKEQKIGKTAENALIGKQRETPHGGPQSAQQHGGPQGQQQQQQQQHGGPQGQQQDASQNPITSAYNKAKDSLFNIEIEGPLDQSAQINQAADETIANLNAVLQGNKMRRCLVNGFANLFDHTSPLVIAIMTDVMMETALKDPNLRLIINSKIQDMVAEIFKELTPEEIKDIADNMDGECRISFLQTNA